MKKVIIVGSDIYGMIANYILVKNGLKPFVVDENLMGGDFLSGGFKYVKNCSPILRMFNELDLAYSDYSARGGILLRGGVKQYPNYLTELPLRISSKIKQDYYRKTRKAEPGRYFMSSMNESASSFYRAVRCDFADLVFELSSFIDLYSSGVEKIDSKDNVLILRDGNCIKYDYLILTIPLWEIKEIVDENFYIPSVEAMARNLITVSPVIDKFVRWDYIFTPYTPSDAIHIISSDGCDLTAEANGGWSKIEKNVLEDLAYIFSDGYYIKKIEKGLKGHLMQNKCKSVLPNNVALIGKYSQWSQSMTIDKTFSSMGKILDRWNLKKKSTRKFQCFEVENC
jgi:hypothetical protein